MSTLNLFCASGGGSRGAFQGGALEALTAAGIELHGLVGVSTGSIQAAFLALAEAGLEPQRRQIEVLREIWFGLRGEEDVYRKPSLGQLGLAWAVLRGRPSLYSLAPFEALLARHIQSAPRRPVRLGAVDLVTGRFVAEGPKDAEGLRRAVRASAAIPFFFSLVPPSLVDGSVRDSAPVGLAFDLAAEMLAGASTPPLDLSTPSETLPATPRVRLFVVLASPLTVMEDARPWHAAPLLEVGLRAVAILEAENYAWDVEGARRLNTVVAHFAQHPELPRPPFLAGKIHAELIVIEPQSAPYSTLTFEPQAIRAYWQHGRERAAAALAALPSL
jgi:predicted acylesterase/phospholipase RssA